MTKVYQIEHLAPQIIRVTWHGPLTRDNFREATEERAEYAKNHVVGNYVFIFNLTGAVIAMMDVRLTAWAANIDPRLVYTLVVGRHGISTQTAKLLGRFTKLKVEFVNNDDEAIEKAQLFLAHEALKNAG